MIIVGAPAAVGEDVADYLRDERGFDVARWHGDTRTETAAVVASEALDRFDFDAETTRLARGDGPRAGVHLLPRPGRARPARQHRPDPAAGGRFDGLRRRRRRTAGPGGPLAPAVHDVVSQDDSFTQHIELHPVDALAAGEQVTLDLSDAEQGPVSYAGAEATVERGTGAATLDVATGSSAELTYTVDAGGDAPDEGAVRIRLHPVTTGQVGENERYEAVVTRQGTGEAQTARFWVGQPPFH